MDKRYTWSDYQTWPDDERWEIIGARAYAMSPSPSFRHQAVSGEIHVALTQLEEAAADFALAEDAARDGGDQPTQVHAMVGQAHVLTLLKRLEDAEQLGARATGIAHSAGYEVGVAAAEARLASIHMVRGNLAEAERYFQGAIPLLQKSGPPGNPVVPGAKDP